MNPATFVTLGLCLSPSMASTFLMAAKPGAAAAAEMSAALAGPRAAGAGAGPSAVAGSEAAVAGRGGASSSFSFVQAPGGPRVPDRPPTLVPGMSPVLSEEEVLGLFKMGEVLACDLGNAEGQGFRAHREAMLHVWDVVEDAAMRKSFISYDWMCGFAEMLPKALDLDKAETPRSSWRVLRTDWPRGEGPANGYTVVWSPTFKKVLVAGLLRPGHDEKYMDGSCEEVFCWTHEANGTPLTMERVREILKPCLTDLGSWAPYLNR